MTESLDTVYRIESALRADGDGQALRERIMTGVAALPGLMQEAGYGESASGGSWVIAEVAGRQPGPDGSPVGVITHLSAERPRWAGPDAPCVLRVDMRVGDESLRPQWVTTPVEFAGLDAQHFVGRPNTFHWRPGVLFNSGTTAMRLASFVEDSGITNPFLAALGSSESVPESDEPGTFNNNAELIEGILRSDADDQELRHRVMGVVRALPALLAERGVPTRPGTTNEWEIGTLTGQEADFQDRSVHTTSTLVVRRADDNVARAIQPGELVVETIRGTERPRQLVIAFEEDLRSLDHQHAPRAMEPAALHTAGQLAVRLARYATDVGIDERLHQLLTDFE